MELPWLRLDVKQPNDGDDGGAVESRWKCPI